MHENKRMQRLQKMAAELQVEVVGEPRLIQLKMQEQIEMLKSLPLIELDI